MIPRIGTTVKNKRCLSDEDSGDEIPIGTIGRIEDMDTYYDEESNRTTYEEVFVVFEGFGCCWAHIYYLQGRNA